MSDASTAEQETRPYGSWPTPITSELVTSQAVTLSEVAVDGAGVVLAEGRPHEGGRVELVRVRGEGTDAEATDLLGPDWNARTSVHEYGGGAWWTRDGVVYFTEWTDQRLYRRDPETGAIAPLTPPPAIERGLRYADGEVSPDGTWIACIRERHAPEGGSAAVVNEIVRLDARHPSEPEVLVSGPDFVIAPRVDPTGERLAWIEWDHPNMPWDDTRLRVRDLADDRESTVAGGPGESVLEPAWQPDGSLTFLSDRTGYWSLYRHSAEDGVTPLIEIGADIGTPPWVLGRRRYAVLEDGRIVFAVVRDGADRLAVRGADGTVRELDLPFSHVETIHPAGARAVVLVGATPAREPSVVRVELDDEAGVTAVSTLRAARELGLPEDIISVPESVSFPSAAGRTAHGRFHPPANPACAAPAGERPPLVVMVHGGPTSAAPSFLQLAVQYWTSRGFAVLDVNHGGSTGYGRAFRELLRGSWGVVDVEDCIAGARWLADQGRVDPDRLFIRGGSAGGFTTLAALAHPGTPFAAGASAYGVADLEALAQDTHKFESRYLDGLLGPYPEARATYRERSPIEHIDDFTRPLIALQGLQDTVVAPRQSEMIVEALRAKGVPVAYLTFAKEGHGFRRVENIRRRLDGELSFYAQVFGFPLPPEEEIEPVAIENPPAAEGRA